MLHVNNKKCLNGWVSMSDCIQVNTNSGYFDGKKLKYNYDKKSYKSEFK